MSSSRLRALRPLTAVAILTLAAAGAPAADRTIRGRQLQLKDPRPADPTKRKIVGQAKETLSPETIVGDPTVDGATLTVFVDGASPASQPFTLPATGWRAVATGFKYRDSTGLNGPVRSAQIQRTSN